LLFEQALPFPVQLLLAGLEVDAAVHLYGQPVVIAVKVEDVRVDGMLAPKLQAIEFAAAQSFPK
jgi:hypothetical protein